MIARLFSILAALFAVAVFTNAQTAPSKKDDTVILSPFVVTEKSRGIVPVNGWFRYSPLTGNVKSPVTITGTMHPERKPEDYNVEKGEQIIAIDGRRIIGMDRHDLVRHWMETGDAGEVVKLTLRGTGDKASTFREVIVKRIPPPRRPAP